MQFFDQNLPKSDKKRLKNLFIFLSILFFNHEQSNNEQKLITKFTISSLAYN